MDSYDVVVLGGGTGGYATALRAAQLGRRVALVEREDRLGGTCLLRGCIPTKALLRSAEILDEVRRADTWGISASGSPDREAIIAFKDDIVARTVSGLTHLVRTRKVEVVTGEGRLVDGPAVEVGGRLLEAGDVALATGSRPKLLPGVELGPRVMTSDRALELESIPGSVVVIGAGAIGSEFASFYRSLGAEVTVLEALPRIAPLEDEEISKWLARAFKKRGIAIHAGASVTAVRALEDRVEVDWAGAREDTVGAELCLVAVGRGPASDGLAESGVTLERGAVVVDEHLRTNLPHVWAVGDVTDTPLQFAHVAFAEGAAVAERTAGLDVPPIDYVGVPRVTFSTPEVASVGLTEAEAVDRHGAAGVSVSRFDLRALGKASIVGEGGLVKLIAADGRVVGAHLIGPHATDLISEPMLMTNLGLGVEDVARFIHPHPTLGEGIGEALLGLAGKPLHSL